MSTGSCPRARGLLLHTPRPHPWARGHQNHQADTQTHPLGDSCLGHLIQSNYPPGLSSMPGGQRKMTTHHSPLPHHMEAHFRNTCQHPDHRHPERISLSWQPQKKRLSWLETCSKCLQSIISPVGEERNWKDPLLISKKQLPQPHWLQVLHPPPSSSLFCFLLCAFSSSSTSI